MENKFTQTLESICEDLKGRPNLVGILLFGSLAIGQAHDNSDIDLIAIGHEEKHRTECFYLNNIPVQIIWRSPDLFKEKIMKRTRTLPMSQTCKVLYDKTGQVQDAVDASKQNFNLGPLRLTDQEKLMRHADLSTGYQNLLGLMAKGAQTSVVILMHKLLLTGIELYYDHHGYYLLSDKYIFSDLNQKNQVLGKLAERIVNGKQLEQQLRHLKEFKEIILKDLGGPIDKYELVW